MSILFFRFDPENIHTIKKSRRFSINTFAFFNDEGLNGVFELPKKLMLISILLYLKIRCFQNLDISILSLEKLILCKTNVLFIKIK